MKMGKSPRFQICTFSLLFVAALVIPSATCSYFLGSGLSPFAFTVSILVLSTVFIFTFKHRINKASAQNPVPNENPINGLAKYENPICDFARNERPICDLERSICHSEVEKNLEQEEVPEESEIGVSKEEDVQSDSEESSAGDSVSSESFELDWIYGSNKNEDQKSMIFTSESVSEQEEEDGLIEIAIPCSDSVPLSEEKETLKQRKQSSLSKFLPESLIKQQDLLELLADINEVNEEENLIEIDLSMGSIKCSRLEIEA